MNSHGLETDWNSAKQNCDSCALLLWSEGGPVDAYSPGQSCGLVRPGECSEVSELCLEEWVHGIWLTSHREDGLLMRGCVWSLSHFRSLVRCCVMVQQMVFNRCSLWSAYHSESNAFLSIITLSVVFCTAAQMHKDSCIKPRLCVSASSSDQRRSCSVKTLLRKVLLNVALWRGISHLLWAS